MKNVTPLQIEECRADHKKAPKFASCGIMVAVIVKTLKSLGVQYWTPAQIQTGSRVNSDRSTSYYVANL